MRRAAVFLTAMLLTAAAPKVSRQSIIDMERSLDRRVQDLWNDNPFVLLGATRGLYLDGYGVAFTAEINLATGPTMTVRSAVNPQVIASHRAKKLERLPQLERSLREQMVNMAAHFDTLPAEEQIVIGVALSRYPWEDATGLPSQLLMQATKAKLAAAEKQGAAAVEAAIRVQKF